MSCFSVWAPPPPPQKKKKKNTQSKLFLFLFTWSRGFIYDVNRAEFKRGSDARQLFLKARRVEFSYGARSF